MQRYKEEPPRWTFGHFLMGLEIVWILFYIGINVACLVVTDMFLPFVAGDDIRSEFFGLSLHILTAVTLVGLLAIRQNNSGWRPSVWAVFFFLFLLYRDVYLLTKMARFSSASKFAETYGLWVAGLVITAYQVALTTLLGIWCVVSVKK